MTTITVTGSLAEEIQRRAAQEGYESPDALLADALDALTASDALGDAERLEH